jgi:hypothetical protein
MKAQPDQESHSASRSRQQQRLEVRGILLFIRAAKRLRELTVRHPLTFKIEFEPAWVQPADPRKRVMVSMKLAERVDPLVMENLASRLRPFLLSKEECFFPRIVKALPNHVRIEEGPMTFAELSAKWKATLRDTTAPLPAGIRIPNLIPGYTAESTAEGRIKLMVDHQLLTGKEVMDLLFNGELMHRDRDKEKKLIRIRQAGMGASFDLAVIAVAATLAKLVDILLSYCEEFVKQIPPETIADIEENIT